MNRALNSQLACLMIASCFLSGCGPKELPATVEGTLRMEGQPLDRCLITFLPEPGQNDEMATASGMTDAEGRYRLQSEDQRDGAATGNYRVTIQDMAVSTGVRRRDHGTADLQREEGSSPPKVRRSRIPKAYSSASTTPWRKEIEPGHQVVDLEIP